MYKYRYYSTVTPHLHLVVRASLIICLVCSQKHLGANWLETAHMYPTSKMYKSLK